MGLVKKKKEPQPPAFKGNGVAVWVNQTEDGRDYLSIKILDSFYVNAWDNSEPKEKDKEQVNN